jgi:hypothetical protein
MESLLPFLQGTCTPYNMPVYPGAQCQIAKLLIENVGTVQSASSRPVTRQTEVAVALGPGLYPGFSPATLDPRVNL